MVAGWSRLAGAQTASQSPSASPAAEASRSVEIAIARHQLPNGLRVVLSPDPTARTASIALYYDVGSRAEPRGQTGFAHLFEHLMFEGTEALPKGEYDRLLSLFGANSNATTSEDRTNYFAQLPPNALELGLWLEADRLRGLAVSAEAFENQRLTVMEERRQSYENRPYGLSLLRRDALFYDGYFPYAHSTIGDVEDLEMPGVAPAEQVARVRAFHTRFYAPDNAVLAVSGAFDPAEALRMVTEHFGPITRRRGEVFVDPGFTPPVGERVAHIDDPLAEVPGVHIVWHIPPRRTPDHYALEVLAEVLGGGESSRFHRTLVKEREIVAEFDFDTEDRRGPDMLALWMVCARGHSAVEARRAVDALIARVLAEGVTARELEKARNAIRGAFVFGLESTLSRAQYLAMTELYDGDAALVNTELARYEAVTRDDILRVARRYLVPTNRLVLEVRPVAPATSAATPSR